MASAQTALITGASDGIGLELAKIFAGENYRLIIVSDNRSKLEEARQEISSASPVEIHIIESDLSTREGAQFVYSEVQQSGWQVDVLVNNAGVGVYGKFAETDLAEELAMIELNINSVVQLSKLFVNDMLRQNGGKILFTSSVAGLAGSPYLSVYGATKAFDFIFAMGLREELEDTNITVTALLPAETDTNFFHRAGMENSKIVRDGDMADPAKVAQAGFEALMAGKSHVGSPFKAKMFEFMSDILPEDWKASMSKKQQEPVDA